VHMTNEELIRKYDDLISAAKSARENARKYSPKNVKKRKHQNKR